MLTVARNESYLFISIQIEDLFTFPPGPVDPYNNPLATIYRDVSGAPVLATDIAGGNVALIKQLGLTGFYGIGLPITPTTPLGRYLIRIIYEIGDPQQQMSYSQVQLLHFEVVDPGNSISKALSVVG